MIQINEKNFESEVMKSELPVLLDFWAEWCPPCRMMGPVFEELSADFKGKVKFAKLNTEEAAGISQRFGVSSIPSLVLTKKGKEVDRIVGFAPKDTLKARINAMITKL